MNLVSFVVIECSAFIKLQIQGCIPYGHQILRRFSHRCRIRHSAYNDNREVSRPVARRIKKVCCFSNFDIAEALDAILPEEIVFSPNPDLSRYAESTLIQIIDPCSCLQPPPLRSAVRGDKTVSFSDLPPSATHRKRFSFQRPLNCALNFPIFSICCSRAHAYT